MLLVSLPRTISSPLVSPPFFRFPVYSYIRVVLPPLTVITIDDHRLYGHSFASPSQLFVRFDCCCLVIKDIWFVAYGC